LATPIDYVEETRQKPLKKHEFKRPGYFVRYEPKQEGGPDIDYNYEATQEDLQFLAELKGSPFEVKEFDSLIDTFEQENEDLETVKSLVSMAPVLDRLQLKKPGDAVEKIYDV